ncbi:molybdopterin-guanine dinucleotide biosynthesis protein B [candidate division KSB1 bacterium]|nr:molybdopterin-guanine dinucleotide biosynthesis protein B [candidate division KSB1 bacterium]
MKVVQVVGYHNTGKTTVVKELVKRLKMGNSKVATIKHIHEKNFELDKQNSNSYVHKKAGADLTIISAGSETDFLYNKPMELLEIACKISADWLIVEGFNQFPLPNIVCGKTEQEVDDFFNKRTLFVSGIISKTKQSYRNLPVLNSMVPDQADQISKLVLKKVFPMLPYVEDKCCNLCGLTCSKMVEAIVQGDKKYEDCLIRQTNVHLKIGGREIQIVPFVQQILENNILALVQELDGWEKGKTIEVKINN